MDSSRMETLILALLCLSGWSVSSGRSHHYHYVAKCMTWTEAQTYCRQTYKDLATIQSHEEMLQLQQTVLSSGINSEVWIGLHGETTWRWSDSYTGNGADYRNWGSEEPTIWPLDQLCVVGYNVWWTASCEQQLRFTCYTGTEEDRRFVFVDILMTWYEAQRYCRENFTDLALVRNYTEHQMVTSSASFGAFSWIGLYGEPQLEWSDGSGLSYQNWDTPKPPPIPFCFTVDVERPRRWRALDCNQRLPFVCYSIPEVSVKVIKVRVKHQEPSLDLNDPAVNAALLKQFQDTLAEKGLAGVSLKWRKQPDDKVFHMEEKPKSVDEREESCPTCLSVINDDCQVKKKQP